jgi:long-chain acyl-CoA synthetase
MAYVGTLNDGSTFAPRRIENKLKFLPYIREAVAFGDGRDKVCVLIDIEISATGNWADGRGVSYTGHAELAAHEDVYTLVADCIARVNARLAAEPLLAQSQIHRFVILGKELSADEGALTRTGKLRRHVIAEQYRALVDAMYGGHAGVRFGDETDEVKIRDAKVVAPAQIRRVA